MKPPLQRSKAKRRTKHELLIEAHTQCSRWLGNANEALERGDKKTCTKYEERAQRWLDRINVIEGNN